MRHLSDANAQDGNFGTQIRSAIFWRSGSQIVSQVVSWTSTLIVVRLLDPADYGLFAMTLVVLNFMGFMNGYGLVSALVQAPVLNIQQIRRLGVGLHQRPPLPHRRIGAHPRPGREVEEIGRANV